MTLYNSRGHQSLNPDDNPPNFSGELRIYNDECYSWERFLDTFGENGLDACINEWNGIDFCPTLFRTIKNI